MRTVLITYDLRTPGKDYGALVEEIKSIGAWWHYLQSTWIVVTPLEARQVCERLRTRIDSNDHLLVVTIHARDGMDGWLPKAAWDWLAANVTG